MPLDILKTVELSYDYSQIPDADRDAVRHAAMEIKPRLKRAAEDIFSIGSQLSEVKDRLPHGQWGPWLEQEFDLTDRTARRFMEVTSRLTSKSDKLSGLTASALYLLASPSTPDEVVESVADKAASGEKVSYTEVKKAIAEAKPATASVDDLTRHIGSWLSQQIGTPAEMLTNAARRDHFSRRHLENFLNRREVKFAVRTLEDAIAEVMSNVVNTGAADTELRGPMPTMTHKDVDDLKKAQAATPPPTDNTSLSVDTPAPVVPMSKALSTPSYNLDFEEWIDDGWKILMPGGKWQAVNHNQQLATAVVSSSEILLNLMRLRKWSSENYFIDEDTPDSATVRKETETARWAWGISRQHSDIHTKLVDASRDSLDHAPLDGPLLANINKAINHVLDAKTSLAKAISTGRIS